MHKPSAVMPSSTAALFEILRHERDLHDFYLIGGTALALHLAHRLSEDLDFITPAVTLPRKRIDDIIARLRARPLNVKRNDSAAAYDDFQNDGQCLHDHNQSFIIGDACKLTFFSADNHHRRLLTSSLCDDGPTVAALPELRDLKAIVCASRSSSRDWLDLYTLARDYKFDGAQWRQAFERAGLTPVHFQTALSRIRSGDLPSTDPGFASLLQYPPTINEIVTLLVELSEQ